MTIPVTVLGGYLGAGKTTLLNHLLRDARGLRLAVLVNDFGEIGIDAELIESREGNVLNLAGGCVCCSFGSDLVGALLELPQRVPPPGHVLIETSGVALPRAVGRTVNLAGGGLALDSVVVVADAETVRERAADRYVGDTVRMQLAEADLIVVSKLDLVDVTKAAGLEEWLQRQSPGARIVHASHGAVPAALVLGPREPGDGAQVGDDTDAGAIATDDDRSARTARGRLFTTAPGDARGESARLRPLPAPADARFTSVSFETADPLDLRRLAAGLVDPALGVLRAKGLLRDLDGTPKSLQLVGSRVEVRESAHANPERGRLVCIGLRDRLDRDAIAARLEAARSVG